MRGYRVLRGGSCRSDWYLRTTHRGWGEPENRRRYRYRGFRIIVKGRKR